MGREPTLEEWFAELCVLRQRAKDAFAGNGHDEYCERYESAIEDIDHALRRGCNRLRNIARHCNKRKSKEQGEPHGE